LPEQSDLGWTHVALPTHNIDASVEFYRDYAGFEVVHDRTDLADGRVIRVVWLADGSRPFVLVLAQSADPVGNPLGPFAHLGIALPSVAAVDEIARKARAAGRLGSGPVDCGPPVGYLCMVRDPDGHTVEFAYGQEVGTAYQIRRN
jgi:lactoylglutathione lyase